MKTIFIISLFLSSIMLAQVEYSQGVISLGDSPGFYLDAATYKSDIPNKTRVDVFIQVPYKNLQFVKNRGEFLAKYSVTLSFYDEDKDDLLLEKVWNAKITAPNFESAASENNFKFDYRSFDLEPETYLMICDLYDKDSKKDYSVEALIEIKEYNKNIQVSDLIFIKTEIDSQIIPNISNTFTSKDSTLYFFYELYSNEKQTLNLKYEIEDADEEIETAGKKVGKVNIQRYKGLGEMNPTQLWDTTMDPAHRLMKLITVEEAAKADEVFETLMGAEVGPRKRFIQTHAKSVKNLDI